MKILLIILTALIIGAYFEIKQFEDFRIKHDCTVFETKPAIFIQVPFFGIVEQTSAKIIYRCSNDEEIVR